LLAEIVGPAEALAAEGRSGSTIADWLRDEAQRRRLTPIGRIGEAETFDRDRHEPAGNRHPRPGQDVRVLRTGFVWTGGGHPVVVAKALVE
jgi:hypothetical protein